MDFIYAAALKEDLPKILEIQKECYLSEAELYNDYTIPPLIQTIESVNEEFDNGWSFIKVLHNNEIIATGRGMIIGNTGYIAKLAVQKEFQNQKLGQQILQAIETMLNNCERYELFTGYKSERNLYLYKKMGYTEFKRQFIHDRLSLIYLEKINFK